MKNPWFPLYVADYVAKTGHLTQGQHGAYLLLMLHYYATGNPIPASTVQVHSICRCTNDAERSAAHHVLSLFFYRDGDFYRHKRIDEELATRSELRTKRQNAASKRWDAKARIVHMHMHTQSQSHTHTQEPNTKTNGSVEETSNIEQATQFLFIEMGLAGLQNRIKCQDAVRAYAHWSKKEECISAQELASSWQRYKESNVKYRTNAVGFLEKAVWKDEESWTQKKSQNSMGGW